MHDPTPCAQAASIKFCISRPSSMQVQGSSPCITSAIASVAPARCPANWPHFDSPTRVSRFFTTTRSHGCVFFDDPVQRPVSRMSSRTSSGISRWENWRTARNDRIRPVSRTGQVYRSALLTPLVKAAVCREFGAPLAIEEVDLAPPQGGELRVLVKACGICQSDVHRIEGAWGGTLPAIFGHEAAGIVDAVGPGV